ncbi:uracil-DNA glycosylase [Natronomonas salina]|uniref:uracil-DNA glycosylase n=1 Tax=Natronomonas salina TaxID=1710540 RepID=UPI0015B5821B|nr:uracil-DNA glycosylase [Natronomonas salina]QLD90490.1 uracil-DNA glycosylase [Natronomonas salina]
MATFPDPDDRNVLAEDCRRCPALAADRTCISWGVGSLEATLVVVGEAPGAGTPEADRWKGGNHTGMAYTARHSGRRVRDLFEGLGYGQDDLYFTNAVKCFPSDGEGSNREPTPAERANCRPYLLEELEEVDPACVVPTGRHATESLLAATDRELDGFVDSVLDPIETDALPPLLPVLHPSYQDVWIKRLGYEPEGYERAIGETLADLGAGPAE